jgi:hypothetical protein
MFGSKKRGDEQCHQGIEGLQRPEATGGIYLLVVGETGDNGGNLLGEGKHFAKETCFTLNAKKERYRDESECLDM